MHAIYPQLDINFTKGILRGVFSIYHSGFHSGPLLGLHICGFKRPVKKNFFNAQRQGWVVKLKTINIPFSYPHFLWKYFLWREGPKGKVYLKSILGWSIFFSFQATFLRAVGIKENLLQFLLVSARRVFIWRVFMSLSPSTGSVSGFALYGAVSTW